METLPLTQVPHWRLRRLAPRALGVLEKKKAHLPSLRTFERTLVPAVEEFVGVYDALRHSAIEARRMAAGEAAARTLHGVLRTWLGPLARDMTGLDTRAITEASVPDDIISSARRLLDAVRGYEPQAGRPLDYRTEFEEELLPAIEAAERKWARAQAKRMDQQVRLARIRAAAAKLHRELVAFRRSLRAAFGSRDLGYRQLCTRAAEQPDPPDEDNLPAPALVTSTAAAPSNGASTALT